MIIHESNTYKQFIKDGFQQINRPDKLIVHHTGGSSSNPRASTAHHTAETVERQHISNGWRGIGYHYVIERNGKIVSGRPHTAEGAHCLGQNRTSIGVVLSGNFDVEDPSEEQLRSFRWLYENKLSGLPIFPHRKFAQKSCYGTRLHDNFFTELIQPQPVKLDNTKEKLQNIIKSLQEIVDAL